MSQSTNPQSVNPTLTATSLFFRLFIYVSVAGAMILPSYVSGNHLNDGFINRSKKNEPTVLKNLGSINRAQQAYYLEHNRFANSIAELNVKFRADTSNYSYRIIQPMFDTSQNTDSNVSMRMAIAQKKDSPKKGLLKNHLGIVYILPQEISASDQSKLTHDTIRGIMCELPNTTSFPIVMPSFNNGKVECPTGTKQVWNRSR